MATLRLFAQAREAAGTGQDELPGETVAQLLGAASERYGEGFAKLLPTCNVWVNGQPASESDAITASDEVAVLPPVSGG